MNIDQIAWPLLNDNQAFTIYIYIYGKGEIAQRACTKMNDTTCLTREFADQADHQPRLTSK